MIFEENKIRNGGFIYGSAKKEKSQREKGKAVIFNMAEYKIYAVKYVEMG
jgi:hypothetical protein